MNLLTRRQRQRPTAREDDLMLLEEAAARQQADIDRLAAERNDCTAEFVVYDVIQAGAPHGASQDLAIIAQSPKDFPPRSNVGFFSSTNCASAAPRPPKRPAAATLSTEASPPR